MSSLSSWGQHRPSCLLRWHTGHTRNSVNDKRCPFGDRRGVLTTRLGILTAPLDVYTTVYRGASDLPRSPQRQGIHTQLSRPQGTCRPGFSGKVVGQCLSLSSRRTIYCLFSPLPRLGRRGATLCVWGGVQTDYQGTTTADLLRSARSIREFSVLMNWKSRG